ncbi:MAG: acetate--CoA ligase family protein [Pseudomonadota bacterium]
MARLARLLNPASIAVVGGGAWCEQVIVQSRKLGFQGQIWAVHPHKTALGGVACVPDLGALPGVPDAVFVGINRAATVDVIRDLAQMGAGGAVCFASGFQEAADGADLQAALLQAAGAMPVIGPNCYGFINYLDRAALWPDQHGGRPVDRGVAIITQSSNIAINLTMQARGLPVSHVVTVGNQAQIGFSQVGAALLDDPRVTVLGLHIEGVGDLAAFADLAAKARELGKPVIALKVGRSAHAAAASVTHTASLAGSDAGADALLARLGIGRVNSLPAFIETLKLLHVVGALDTPALAAMACSGGEAGLIADAAEGTPVHFPPLVKEQADALQQALGPLVTIANPLDYHTFIWGDEAAMTATFARMMSDAVALGIVVLDFPRPDRCTSPDWMRVLNAVEAAQKQVGKPIAVLSSLPETMPEPVAQAMIARGVLPLCGFAEAVEAVSVAASMTTIEDQASFMLPPSVTAGDMLTEAASKAALAAHGVAVPEAEGGLALGDLEDAAARIGYPVVLKGEGVAHKSDAGAVALGIADAAGLSAAVQAMDADSFLVEAQVPGAAVELLVGVVLDPAHGYLLVLGAGGTLTEVMQDKTHLMLPVTEADIVKALDRLRIAPLLSGYRGAAPVDRAAITKAVLAVQDYVQHHQPFEVEINPLLCSTAGAIAVDALIITGRK